MDINEIKQKYPDLVQQIEKEAVESYLDSRRAEVDRFTFFRTYWQSARSMSRSQQAAFIIGILDYAFTGVEPVLQGAAEAAFIAARPNIDISIDNVMTGKNGGRPRNPAAHDKETIAEIIDYLNEKTGKNYKATSSSTMQTIGARLKEGYTVDDCKKVIDNKVADWLNDDNMSGYLRPLTLFNASKFEGYLNQHTAEKGARYADYR